MLFKLFLKSTNQNLRSNMHSRHYISIALIICSLFIFPGCRKAASRGRASHYKSEMTRNEPARGRHRSRRESEPEKSTGKILSGSEIFKKYGKSVFMVFTSDGSNNYQGSGFFIGKHGLAVSNYHVFEGTNIGDEYIQLSYDDETLYKVSDVVYRSKEPDFIIFHVDYENSSYIPIAKSKPSIGDKVFAIGSPRGLENTFSSGEISQIRDSNYLQISVPIDHGSSGGVLLNTKGEAVGITSAGLDYSGANLNFAIDIKVLRKYVKLSN